jgi:hypothetical protein
VTDQQPYSAVDALLAFARRHVDDEAAQALVDEAAAEITGRTVVTAEQQVAPRRFVLRRSTDVSGVSGLGDVADGVVWPDGTAAVRWRGDSPSTVHHDQGAAAVERIHGHGGATRVVYLDDVDLPTPTGAGEVPLVVRRVIEHALRRPVACPKCNRTAPCRCIADRTSARAEIVAGALAPWIATKETAA